ncbi:response regulator [Reyranella sp.]|uniref:response regulator n=1 Tax=Reyranella sp. TaxID=1929291 RepID=UPI003BAB1542
MIGRRILIVEDEYLLAEDLRRYLVLAGAVVVGPAPRLGRAQALIADEAQIDAAVLDVNLAGEPVFPVAEALAVRDVPFVFVSGFDRSTLPPSLSERPLLQKPVDFETLRQVLTDLLRERQEAGPRGETR